MKKLIVFIILLILPLALVSCNSGEKDLVLTVKRFESALKKIPDHWNYKGLMSNDKIVLLNTKTEAAGGNGTASVAAQANHFLDNSGYSTDGYMIVIKWGSSQDAKLFEKVYKDIDEFSDYRIRVYGDHTVLATFDSFYEDLETYLKENPV